MVTRARFTLDQVRDAYTRMGRASFPLRRAMDGAVGSQPPPSLVTPGTTFRRPHRQTWSTGTCVTSARVPHWTEIAPMHDVLKRVGHGPGTRQRRGVTAVQHDRLHAEAVSRRTRLPLRADDAIVAAGDRAPRRIWPRRKRRHFDKRALCLRACRFGRCARSGPRGMTSSVATSVARRRSPSSGVSLWRRAGAAGHGKTVRSRSGSRRARRRSSITTATRRQRWR